MVRLLKLQVFLLFLAVLVVAAGIGDVYAKTRAEAELATQLRKRVDGQSDVRADIRSFPFVGRLAWSGEVPEVRIYADRAAGGSVPLSALEIKMEHVRMDRDEAIHGRARVLSIGSGTVEAHIQQADLSGKFPGFNVQLLAGMAVVSGPGGVKAVLAATATGGLEVQVAGKRVVGLDAPRSGLLPCTPTVTFAKDEAVLTCSFTQPPQVILDIVNGETSSRT